MTRRDRCHLVGRRALRLTRGQAAFAWFFVAHALEGRMAEMDLPKWKHLMETIRLATIAARKPENALERFLTEGNEGNEANRKERADG